MNKEPTTLFIIGNGFDLYHGSKSSYFEFRDFLKKRNRYLSDDLELYFDCENFWGDFENNLVSFSVGSQGKKQFYRILTIQDNCMKKKLHSHKHKVQGGGVSMFMQEAELS